MRAALRVGERRVGGEPLGAAHLHLLGLLIELRPQQAHLAQRHLNKVRVDNVFGPTEGEMTRYVCPRGRPLSTMPVGRPIDGSVVYVLGQIGRAHV